MEKSVASQRKRQVCNNQEKIPKITENNNDVCVSSVNDIVFPNWIWLEVARMFGYSKQIFSTLRILCHMTRRLSNKVVSKMVIDMNDVQYWSKYSMDIVTSIRS